MSFPDIAAKILETLDTHRPGYETYEGGWAELACHGCDEFRGKRLSHLNYWPHDEHRRDLIVSVLRESLHAAIDKETP